MQKTQRAIKYQKKSDAAKLREAKRNATNPTWKIWTGNANISCDENSCWEWQHMEKNRRYARLRVAGKDRLVHRLVYEWFIGEIPDGYYVCHHCDNTKCVRPSHLFTGTAQDNNRDRYNKGRSANGSRNGNAKLNELQVQLIRQDSRPYRDIANSYGITRTMISHIRCGKFWRKDLAHVKKVST